MPRTPTSGRCTRAVTRHTHRGGFGPAPLPAGTIAALRAEAAREGAMLRVVAVGDQRDALAAAVQAGSTRCGWMTTGRPNWRAGSSHRTARAATDPARRVPGRARAYRAGLPRS